MIKTLRIKNQYILFFEELYESISLYEYVDEKGISYFTRMSIIHYLDITENHLLGHSLKEAKKLILNDFRKRSVFGRSWIDDLKRDAIIDKYLKDMD